MFTRVYVRQQIFKSWGKPRFNTWEERNIKTANFVELRIFNIFIEVKYILHSQLMDSVFKNTFFSQILRTVYDRPASER
jgi:hypothetical protein